MVAVGRLRCPQHPGFFGAVLARVRGVLGRFSHADLAGFLSACKQLQFTDEPGAGAWLGEFEQEVALKADTFTADSAARTLRCYASMPHRPSSQTIQLLSNRFAAAPSQLHPGLLASSVWSWGVLGFNPGRRVLEHMLQEAGASMGDFLPREKTKFIWGLASLRAPPTEAFLRAFEQSVASTLSEFSAFDLVTVVWSYSMLRMAPDEALAASVFLRIREGVGSLTLIGLLNTLWSLATLGHEDAALVQALLDELQGRRAQLKSHHYVKIFHQLHKMEWEPDEELTSLMVDEVTQGAHLLSGSFVRNILVACAGLDIEPGAAFMEAVRRRQLEVFDEFRFVPWLNDSLQAYSELQGIPLALLPEEYEDRVTYLEGILKGDHSHVGEGWAA